jgi:PleD family two-component response regulator
VPEVGILIIDNDIASPHALKSVLDSEGWRVRIAPNASLAMTELATGNWNLAIVNVALADTHGPLFAILRELAQAGVLSPEPEPTLARRQFRVLFLVPALAARKVQPLLERDGLPYFLVPYHLNDFLEKVSDLLVEAGAIAAPIRTIGSFAFAQKRRRKIRASREARSNAMFASREDYQMTEEELAEWERQEEEDRKKREKELKDRQHR